MLQLHCFAPAARTGNLRLFLPARRMLQSLFSLVGALPGVAKGTHGRGVLLVWTFWGTPSVGVPG